MAKKEKTPKGLSRFIETGKGLKIIKPKKSRLPSPPIGIALN